MSGFIDLSNLKFGRLTVIRRVISDTKFIFWYCHCECGNEAIVLGGNLKKGHTKSCGCLQSEFTVSRSSTHGLRKSAIYRTWASILQRCNQPRSHNYKNYGAKGVAVCREWYDFKTFHDWAMANGWKRGMNIDKDIIPKRLGIPALLYSPEMCSVVTVKENIRARNATKLTIEKALEIRNSKEKTSVLMAKHGVGKTTIGNIRRGDSWVL